jgi:SHS2 domain-containing protein
VSELFEILEHPADIGFRAWGASPAELFQNAASAMIAIAVETDSIEPRGELPVELNAEGYESLMVDWLSEVLYLFDASRFAARRFLVDEISPKGLRARVLGEPRDPQQHPWKLIVKAVTYHELKVVEKNGRWKAEVYLDV